ncbi:MAG: vitamin-B12 independent methionine synthase [Candidatus Binatia bacterium]
MFKKLLAQRLLLEYDDQRSGSFEPLRDVPDEKFVVLGLVTSKKAHLESKPWLKRRIAEATRYVPMERLGLSPQCGFASSIIGNKITADEQRKKLARVVKTAQDLWG